MTLPGPRTPAVLTKPSLARFVYPFTFSCADFDARCGQVMAQTVGDRTGVWQPSPFSEDDLLQQVHDFLNNDIDSCSTAMRWRITNDALQSRDMLWATAADWALMSEGVSGGASIPFVFDDVHLSLFSSGVGFMSFSVRPKMPRKQASSDLDIWSDLIHFFRFARGQRDVFLRATRRTGKDTSELFVPELARAAVEGRGDSRLYLMDLISGLLTQAHLSSDSGPWWDEIFVPGQLMPYVSLFTTGLAEADIPLAIYRARNFFNSRQDIQPTAANLDLDGNPAILPYVDGAWFTFSLDGGCFITTDQLPDTGFFTGTLPEHIGNLYYVIFLLALHQRFALMRLSNEIAKAWMGDPCDGTLPVQRAALDHIRRDFTLFTTRGYFAQIAQQEHHHTVYRRWQETFQIQRLYDEVRNAVEQLGNQVHDAEQRTSNKLMAAANAQEARRQQREQRRERLFSMLAALFIGPGIVLTFLQTTQRDVSVLNALLWSGVGLAVGVIIVSVFDLWIRNKLPLDDL